MLACAQRRFDWCRLCGVQWIQLRKRVEMSLERRRHGVSAPRFILTFFQCKLGTVFHEVVGDHVADDQVGVFDAAHVGHCYLDAELG